MTFAWIAEGYFAEWAILLAMAPIIGSFLGVLILRLPRGEAVGFARSHCESCGHRLAPRELIPIVSYALQRGKCRHCDAPIGWSHPAIELAAVTVVAWAATTDGGGRLIAGCVLGWCLLALAACDWRSYRLPDRLTLPLILLGLAATWWLQPDLVADHALAAALGYIGFRGVAWLYRRLRGREGLGQGDAKLLAGAGAWLGVIALPYAVLGGALLGLLLAGLLWVQGRALSARTMLPFGPCLALATWLIWLYG
jgi:leader peptidase (prepilin peptidase) / N-methyltransferase